MPTFARGDMFRYSPGPDVYVVTTNKIINRQGQLVMGRGAARRAALCFPGLASIAADYVGYYDFTNYYYLEILSPGGAWVRNGQADVGLLQVKEHWAEPARLGFISESIEVFRTYALQDAKRVYYLNFPGIGNGRLDRAAVLPLLAVLPDNVTVFEL